MDRLRGGLFHACAWLSRITILGLAIVFPWLYGGGPWWSQLLLGQIAVLLAVLGLTATLCSSRRVGRPSRLTLCLCGLLVVGWLQTLSFPEWLVGEGRSLELGRAIGLSPTENGSWQGSLPNSISISRDRSRAALVTLASATVVVWCSAMFFASRKWAIALVGTIAVGGLINASLGLFQSVVWNRWTLLDFPTSHYFSTFVSRNSAPGYFASAVGAVLVLLSVTYKNRKQKRRKEYRLTYPGTSLGARIRNRMEDMFIDLDTLAIACICSIAFLLVVTLATNSRGGVLACLGASSIALCLTLGARENSYRALIVSGAILLLVVGLMSFFELHSPLSERFDQLNQALYEQEDGRLLAWQYTLGALSKYWLTGSGLCTYQFAILPYHAGPPAVWFQHAENLYLEVWVEFGLIGLGCLTLGGFFLMRDVFRESSLRQEELLFVAVVYAVSALAIQSLVDFSLILPGVFLPLCSLVGAFEGRMRRAEAEAEFAQQRDPALADARVRYHVRRASANDRRPRHRWWDKGRLALHMLCGTIVVACLLSGLSSLRGHATSEALGRQVDQFERSLTASEYSGERQELLGQVQQQASRFPECAELQFLTGRLKLLLARAELVSALEWGPVEEGRVWLLTRPLTLRTLEAAASDPEQRAQLKPAYARFQDCSQDFYRALLLSPLDNRAAWGLYQVGLNQFSPEQEAFVGQTVLWLSRNNLAILSNATVFNLATSTYPSPKSELGYQFLQWTLYLDPGRAVGLLETMLASLPAERILQVLPTEVERLAILARAAASKPNGQVLSAQILQKIGDRYQNAMAGHYDGWQALIWVAEQQGDAEATAALIKRTLIAGNEQPTLRLKLAEVLYQRGLWREAIAELERCAARDPANGAVYKELIKKYRSSIDQTR